MMTTELASLSWATTAGTSSDTASPWSSTLAPPLAGCPPSVPKPPRITLMNERFIARHMIYARIAPLRSRRPRRRHRRAGRRRRDRDRVAEFGRNRALCNPAPGASVYPAVPLSRILWGIVGIGLIVWITPHAFDFLGEGNRKGLINSLAVAHFGLVALLRAGKDSPVARMAYPFLALAALAVGVLWIVDHRMDLEDYSLALLVTAASLPPMIWAYFTANKSAHERATLADTRKHALVSLTSGYVFVGAVAVSIATWMFAAPRVEAMLFLFPATVLLGLTVSTTVQVVRFG